MKIYTVDDRYRVNIHGGEVEIYDSKKPPKDELGREIPAKRLSCGSKFTDVECYRQALIFLRDSSAIKPDVFDQAAKDSFLETAEAPALKSTNHSADTKPLSPEVPARRAVRPTA